MGPRRSDSVTRTILRLSAQAVDVHDASRDGFALIRTPEGVHRLEAVVGDLEILADYERATLVVYVCLDRVGAILEGTILEVVVDEAHRRDKSGVVRRSRIASDRPPAEAEDDVDDAFERITR